jgi:hypothetical protein
MKQSHISNHDAERYYLGMVTDEEELAVLEEHILWCHPCLDIVEEAQGYVDLMRSAIINGNYDLDICQRERR